MSKFRFPRLAYNDTVLDLPCVQVAAGEPQALRPIASLNALLGTDGARHYGRLFAEAPAMLKGLEDIVELLEAAAAFVGPNLLPDVVTAKEVAQDLIAKVRA